MSEAVGDYRYLSNRGVPALSGLFTEPGHGVDGELTPLVGSQANALYGGRSSAALPHTSRADRRFEQSLHLLGWDLTEGIEPVSSNLRD